MTELNGQYIVVVAIQGPAGPQGPAGASGAISFPSVDAMNAAPGAPGQLAYPNDPVNPDLFYKWSVTQNTWVPAAI